MAPATDHPVPKTTAETIGKRSPDSSNDRAARTRHLDVEVPVKQAIVREVPGRSMVHHATDAGQIVAGGEEEIITSPNSGFSWKDIPFF